MDFYTNESGQTIFTSQYYLKRGSCCKSNCLHCPYGQTLKNCGVKLISYAENPELIKEHVSKNKSSKVTDNLLEMAFGAKKEHAIEITYLMTLKGIPCGLAYVQNHELLEFKLFEHFDAQGITDTYLRSLL